jgi:hypothetical protein
MATREVTANRESRPSGRASGVPLRYRRDADETKLSLKTTEFWAMVAVVAAILIAAAVSDSFDDVRAWTLIAAVAIGYMISRGLAKSGTKYRGDEDPLNRDGYSTG